VDGYKITFFFSIGSRYSRGSLCIKTCVAQVLRGLQARRRIGILVEKLLHFGLVKRLFTIHDRHDVLRLIILCIRWKSVTLLDYRWIDASAAQDCLPKSHKRSFGEPYVMALAQTIVWRACIQFSKEFLLFAPTWKKFWISW